jgi:transglutaminase-like putative cysteine protease
VRLEVVHETEYQYPTRVELAYHAATLRPSPSPARSVQDYRLEIAPEPSEHVRASDVFGNSLDFFALYGAHERLRVRSSFGTEASPREEPLDPARSPDWESVRDGLRYRAGVPPAAAAGFALPSPLVPLLSELREYAQVSYTPGRPGLEAALELIERIHADYSYETGSTDVSTPLRAVLGQRSGVCQDFAHVAIGSLRAIGMAAAYVSGYLLTDPPPGRERLLGADATHAWIRVWCPEAGWIDLDPTNAVVAGSSHVAIAMGRDYGDVVPLRGVIRGGGEHGLTVRVSVIPV